MSETWDLWFPGAGATGMSFARARVDPAVAGDRVLVHAAPQLLEILVHDDEDGQVVASGQVRRGEEGPMSALVRDGREIRLEDGWRTRDGGGRLVLLPRGASGILSGWEHAEGPSWRRRCGACNRAR